MIKMLKTSELWSAGRFNLKLQQSKIGNFECKARLQLRPVEAAKT